VKQEGVIRVSMVLAITLFYGHGIHGRTRKDFKNIKISCEHRRPGADGAYYVESFIFFRVFPCNSVAITPVRTAHPT
jgi:hypothetical protein